MFILNNERATAAPQIARFLFAAAVACILIEKSVLFYRFVQHPKNFSLIASYLERKVR